MMSRLLMLKNRDIIFYYQPIISRLERFRIKTVITEDCDY